MDFREIFRQTEKVKTDEFLSKTQSLNETVKLQLVAKDDASVTLLMGNNTRYVFRGLTPPLIEKFERMLGHGANFNALHWLEKVVPTNQRFKIVDGKEMPIGEAKEGEPCPACGGTGRTDNFDTGEVECSACEGSGLLDLEETIKRDSNGQWVVKSEKGKKLGGPYATKAEAVKRLRQVEYFKHNESKTNEDVNHMTDEDVLAWYKKEVASKQNSALVDILKLELEKRGVELDEAKLNEGKYLWAHYNKHMGDFYLKNVDEETVKSGFRSEEEAKKWALDNGYLYGHLIKESKLNEDDMNGQWVCIGWNPTVGLIQVVAIRPSQNSAFAAKDKAASEGYTDLKVFQVATSWEEGEETPPLAEAIFHKGVEINFEKQADNTWSALINYSKNELMDKLDGFPNPDAALIGARAQIDKQYSTGIGESKVNKTTSESKVNEDDFMNGGATTANDVSSVVAQPNPPTTDPQPKDEEGDIKSTEDKVDDDAGIEEEEEEKEGEKEYLGNNGADKYFYLYKKPAEGVDESKFTTSSDTSGQPANAKAAEKDVQKSATHNASQMEGKTVQENFGDDNHDNEEIDDLQILDAEDQVVFSAKKHDMDVNDVKAFLMDALKELEISNISYDIVLDYLLPEEEVVPEEVETEEPTQGPENLAQGEPQTASAVGNESKVEESMETELFKKYGLFEEKIVVDESISDEALMVKYGFLDESTAGLFRKFGLMVDEANTEGKIVCKNCGKEVEAIDRTHGWCSACNDKREPVQGHYFPESKAFCPKCNQETLTNDRGICVSCHQMKESKINEIMEKTILNDIAHKLYKKEYKDLTTEEKSKVREEYKKLEKEEMKESKIQEDGEVLPDQASGQIVPPVSIAPMPGTEAANGGPKTADGTPVADNEDAVAVDYSTPDAARAQIQIDYPEEPLTTTAIVFADSFVNDPKVYKVLRKMQWEGIYTDADGLIAQSKIVGDYRNFSPEIVKLLTDRLGNGAKYKLGRNNGPTVSIVLRDPQYSISLSGLKELVKAEEIIKTGEPGEVLLKF